MEEIEKLYLTIWHDFLPWIGKRKKRKKAGNGWIFVFRQGRGVWDGFF